MSWNILVVDDSATTRALIGRTIRLAELPGASVCEAPDGRSALAVLRSRPIDLVLADLHMPEMGGVELTQRMRDDPALRSIPVVIVSAEPDLRRLEALKSQGVAGVIRKPFKPEDIRRFVNEMGERASPAKERPAPSLSKGPCCPPVADGSCVGRGPAGACAGAPALARPRS